jgi:predicted phosphodiesterase
MIAERSRSMPRPTVRRSIVLLALAALGALALNSAASEFTVVLFPDTQYYSLNTPDTYRRQTQWVADNRTAENIRFAIHLGDITHKNTPTEWQRASAAHQILEDAHVRYSMLPGNHDYVRDHGNLRRNTDNYNSFFGPERFIGQDAYGGAYGGRNDNNVMFFENDDLRFMVVSLEFAATKDAICWADSVIARHPDRRVIVATHCYLDKDGNYQGDCATSYHTVGASGEELFDELVAKHSNIFMVVAGHVYGSSHTPRPRPHFGDVVHEMLVDYQNEDYVGPRSPTPAAGTPNGNGWMRTLRFLPAENKIRARTFTVNSWVAKFNKGFYDPDPSDPDHAFELDYDMQAPLQYRFHAGSGLFRDRTVNPVSTGDQWLPGDRRRPDRQLPRRVGG